MTFYCPECWKEINEVEETCPFCNADILKYEGMDYEKKLIKCAKAYRTGNSSAGSIYHRQAEK